MNVALQRLHNQRIAGTRFEQPSDVVGWLGAVQAQDYLGALWAVGLRMQSATERDIEQALADRTILRTWPMRGTLHFIAAEDVRWMLELMTPPVPDHDLAEATSLSSFSSTTASRARSSSGGARGEGFSQFFMNHLSGWGSIMNG